MPITLNGSTGVFAPALSGTLNAADLPNASVPTAKLATGAVLQVVQNLVRGTADASKVTTLATTSSTFQNILTATITPQRTTSRILIIAGCGTYSGTTQRGSTRLLRAGTEIDASQYNPYDAGIFVQYSHIVLDTHGVTAGTPITYSFQGRSINGAVVNFGYGDSGGGPSAFVTLMEIA